MTVKGLKAALMAQPDDARVVVPAFDHSYREASVELTTGLYSAASREWTEDYGEEATPEAEYGKRLPVVVIR